MPTREQMERDPYWDEERKAQGERLRELFLGAPVAEEIIRYGYGLRPDDPRIFREVATEESGPDPDRILPAP